ERPRPAVSSRAFGRRSWTWARGVPLLVAAATIAGAVAAVAWTTSQPQTVQMLALAGVIVVGVLCFVAGRARFGAPAVRRRVAEARRRWAASRGWTFTGDQPAADPAIVDLLLPRGRQQPQPVASMRGTFGGRPAVVETWE